MLREVTQKDIGKHCVYVDATGKRHDALINAVHGTKCVNVVIVVDDPNQTDIYGRKTFKGFTSVMHGSVQQAHGWYWLWPGETREEPKHVDTAKE